MSASDTIRIKQTKKIYPQHEIKTITLKYFQSGKFLDYCKKNKKKYHDVYLDYYGKKAMIKDLKADFFLNLRNMVSQEILVAPTKYEMANISLPFSKEMIDLLSDDSNVRDTFDNVSFKKQYNTTDHILHCLSKDEQCNKMLDKFKLELSDESKDLGDDNLSFDQVLQFYKNIGCDELASTDCATRMGHPSRLFFVNFIIYDSGDIKSTKSKASIANYISSINSNRSSVSLLPYAMHDFLRSRQILFPHRLYI